MCASCTAALERLSQNSDLLPAWPGAPPSRLMPFTFLRIISSVDLFSGMCVNLRCIPAPKARNRTAQGGRARDSGLWNPGIGQRIEVEPCKGGAAAVPPLQGLLHACAIPGACAPGFAVPRLQR